MCEYFCIEFIDFMLACKKLADYTNLFTPHEFKKNDDILCIILRMNESNSIEAIDRTNLTEQTKF